MFERHQKKNGKTQTSPATSVEPSVSHPTMNSDQALVSSVLNGERQALRQFIKQHERLVSHMVARLVDDKSDREEICQDIFMKAYEKLGEFNFQSKLSTWVATIAYRHGVNHLRKQKMKFSDLPMESDDRVFVEKGNLETELEDNDMEAIIFKNIDRLPAQYKVVLTLYHLDGMSYEEIGEATGMPEGTVKNYLFRARNLLKESVNKFLGKEEAV
jgi:RNA polymerase sigma factor (sigma-70 family)